MPYSQVYRNNPRLPSKSIPGGEPIPFRWGWAVARVGILVLAVNFCLPMAIFEWGGHIPLLRAIAETITWPYISSLEHVNGFVTYALDQVLLAVVVETLVISATAYVIDVARKSQTRNDSPPGNTHFPN